MDCPFLCGREKFTRNFLREIFASTWKEILKMAITLTREDAIMNLWRELNQEEEKEFRDAARKNYKPLTEISGVWHPVYQDECVKINKENSDFSLEGM